MWPSPPFSFPHSHWIRRGTSSASRHTWPTLTLASGEKMQLTGFMVVNRQRLKALTGETMVELAQTDELELLFLHLQSMRHFTALKDRLVATAPAAPSAAQAEDASPVVAH